MENHMYCGMHSMTCDTAATKCPHSGTLSVSQQSRVFAFDRADANGMNDCIQMPRTTPTGPLYWLTEMVGGSVAGTFRNFIASWEEGVREFEKVPTLT